MPKVSFSVTADGVKAIYSPASAKMLQGLGDIEIRRASHVEPGSGLKAAAVQHLKDTNRWDADSLTSWFADMSPTTGSEVVLGPYATNTMAIEAEVAFLREHMRNEPLQKAQSWPTTTASDEAITST